MAGPGEVDVGRVSLAGDDMERFIELVAVMSNVQGDRWTPVDVAAAAFRRGIFEQLETYRALAAPKVVP
jgi:hypothetical protein